IFSKSDGFPILDPYWESPADKHATIYRKVGADICVIEAQARSNVIFDLGRVKAEALLQSYISRFRAIRPHEKIILLRVIFIAPKPSIVPAHNALEIHAPLMAERGKTVKPVSNVIENQALGEYLWRKGLGVNGVEAMARVNSLSIAIDNA